MANAPAPIAALLHSPAFALAARIALTCAFWWGGFAKLFDFEGALAEAQHFVGPSGAMAVAVLTIAVELIGSALLIAGRLAWLGAGALGVFTVLATLIAHNFWQVQDAGERFREFNTFLEHIGLVGGLALAAVLADASRKTLHE
ncbi:MULTISPECIES: DoxX family protein [unclassified Variovorax]|uniref:DoxX family protein n=1 Tax=unclassified Variovorax TaxID=663243 RepID=UPI003F474836